MSLPRIATRDEWAGARRDLLKDEKELTRQRDEISTKRRELPMVPVEEDYVFDGPSGAARLLDMFDGRSQLIIYHFMFHPEWEEGCPSCTAGIDEVSKGFVQHLNVRDTSFALVSRAPLAKLERYRAARGWDLPWYSSFGTDFNYDYGVTIDASRGFDVYNFRTLDEYAAMSSPTRSPCPTPRSTSAAASEEARASSSAQVTSRSPKRTATDDPCQRAQ